jgi:hypothetical protein
MLEMMAFRDDPRGWAKAQAERLRSDPRGWSREQASRLRELVDVAPFSDEAVERELAAVRELMDRLSELGPDDRQRLHEELFNLHERLSPSSAGVTGAKIGLAAAVLPVIGFISGPLAGSAYGVYRSKRLAEVRAELKDMMRRLARE